MSSREKKDAWSPKKPYTKPEVKQVQLKPEEAVLGGCKTAPTASGGQTGGLCNLCAGIYAS
jgi:hypothetical protein